VVHVPIQGYAICGQTIIEVYLMPEENMFLEQKLEGLADHVSRYLNLLKSQLLMKGYKLKKEWDVQEKTGILSRRDIGGMLQVEKKFKKKHQIKIKTKIDEDDILFSAWSAKSKKEIPPELIVELEKILEKTLEKIKK